MELINYRRDGTPFWNRLNLYPVGGSPGRPKFYVGNQARITAPSTPMQAVTPRASLPLSLLRRDEDLDAALCPG